MSSVASLLGRQHAAVSGRSGHLIGPTALGCAASMAGSETGCLSGRMMGSGPPSAAEIPPRPRPGGCCFPGSGTLSTLRPDSHPASSTMAPPQPATTERSESAEWHQRSSSLVRGAPSVQEIAEAARAQPRVDQDQRWCGWPGGGSPMRWAPSRHAEAGALIHSCDRRDTAPKKNGHPEVAVACWREWSALAGRAQFTGLTLTTRPPWR